MAELSRSFGGTALQSIRESNDAQRNSGPVVVGRVRSLSLFTGGNQAPSLNTLEEGKAHASRTRAAALKATCDQEIEFFLEAERRGISPAFPAVLLNTAESVEGATPFSTPHQALPPPPTCPPPLAPPQTLPPPPATARPASAHPPTLAWDPAVKHERANEPQESPIPISSPIPLQSGLVSASGGARNLLATSSPASTPSALLVDRFAHELGFSTPRASLEECLSELLALLQEILNADIHDRSNQGVLAVFKSFVHRMHVLHQKWQPSWQWGGYLTKLLISVSEITWALDENVDVVPDVKILPATPTRSLCGLCGDPVPCLCDVDTEKCRICEKEFTVRELAEHTKKCAAAARHQEMGAVEQSLAKELHVLTTLSSAPEEIIGPLKDICARKPNELCDEELAAVEEIMPVVQNVMDDIEALGDDATKQMLETTAQEILSLLHAKADILQKAIDAGENQLGDSSSPLHLPTIRDFRILNRISSGAFGRVFLAQKYTTGDLFAIKVIRKCDVLRKNQANHIRAEKTIMNMAGSPFTVNLFYSFQSARHLYLVMEYHNGGDCCTLLKAFGRFEESHARAYLSELTLALEYIHSLGIVHRDIKPDNLLIDHMGHVRLTDFGLSSFGLRGPTSMTPVPAPRVARLKSSGRRHKRSHSFHSPQRAITNVTHHLGEAVGTPDYSAPEIVLGDGHSFAADWWSVGVVAYEFLVGVPPFHGPTVDVIFSNVLNCRVNYSCVETQLQEDFISALLKKATALRLGAKGAHEVKQHPFFEAVDWDALPTQREVQEGPVVPKPADKFDLSYHEDRAVPGSRFDMMDDDLRADLFDETFVLSPSVDVESAPNKDVFSNFDDFSSVNTESLLEYNKVVSRTARLEDSPNISRRHSRSQSAASGVSNVSSVG